MTKVLLVGLAAVVFAGLGVWAWLLLSEGAEATDRGTCVGSTYEFSAEPEDGSLEVSFELQSAGPGETWQVVLNGDGQSLLEGERTTDEDGEIDVDAIAADTIIGSYGEFDVVCQGVVISGAEPRPAAGWRTVTFETGPDDDVDATFESADSIVEVEIYCNVGRPTVAEEEVGTRPDADD